MPAEVYRCTKCGTKWTVRRNRFKEKNHIKTMWCWQCNKMRAFIKLGG